MTSGMGKGPTPQATKQGSGSKQQARVARAVGALGAAGVGFWLGQELFRAELADLDEDQKLVYFQDQAGQPPDLWLGATDVRPGDRVRVSGPVKKVSLHAPRDSRTVGLERPARGHFTSVVVQAGAHELPFFFAGDLRERFEVGRPTTIYTGILGQDVQGRPSERLALGHRGGSDLLTQENLEAPVNWEPMAMAVGMGLAVLKGGSKKEH